MGCFPSSEPKLRLYNTINYECFICDLYEVKYFRTYWNVPNEYVLIEYYCKEEQSIIDEHISARIIQKGWNECSSNPRYKLARKIAMEKFPF